MSATSSINPCDFCGLHIQTSMDRCPHCGRPSLFPNVTEANSTVESEALERRYQVELNKIDPAIMPVLQSFETAVAIRSQAVLARYATEAFRLAVSCEELYASFYGLVQAGARLPSDNFWDRIRGVVDEKLFSHFKEHIRFAALSLTQRGLSHYGDCFIVLKENMIAHRATVFEENTVVFMQRHNVSVTGNVPAGHRGSWQKRGNLAIAKLASEISPRTAEVDFPELLMSNGATAEDDRFVEVHIYGSLSIHTVKAMSLLRSGSAVRRKALQEKLSKYGIPLEHA